MTLKIRINYHEFITDLKIRTNLWEYNNIIVYNRLKQNIKGKGLTKPFLAS